MSSISKHNDLSDSVKVLSRCELHSSVTYLFSYVMKIIVHIIICITGGPFHYCCICVLHIVPELTLIGKQR